MLYNKDTENSVCVCVCVCTHLREEIFLPVEWEPWSSLAFKLPALLEELKSASLPVTHTHT